MAQVTAPVTITKIGLRDGFVASWTLTSTAPTGDPIEMPSWRDRSVQISGTFDSSTVILEGSNDGTTYFTLNDPQGTAISVTSGALVQIEEATRFIRPSSSGGSTSQSVVVTVLLTGKEFV